MANVADLEIPIAQSSSTRPADFRASSISCNGEGIGRERSGADAAAEAAGSIPGGEEMRATYEG